MLFFTKLSFYAQQLQNVSPSNGQMIAAPISSNFNAIQFSYDINGNQIGRRRVILPTISGPSTQETYKQVLNIEPKPIINDISNNVKYYPNPVVDILSVSWNNKSKSFVSEIRVFNMAGQNLKIISMNERDNQIEIDFRDFSEGFYEVILFYNNGFEKSLKILHK